MEASKQPIELDLNGYRVDGRGRGGSHFAPAGFVEQSNLRRKEEKDSVRVCQRASES